MTHRHIPAPRLCHLVKSEDYEGFGFNLYQEKSKPGQFIGRIEPGSPAERAGLVEDDKIVEVNGVNVAKENHKEVVARIKEKSSETTLLVVDKVCEDYHKEQRKVVHSNLPYVEYISSEIFDEEDDEEYINTDLQVIKVSEEDTEIDNSKETTPDKIEVVTRTDSGVGEEHTGQAVKNIIMLQIVDICYVTGALCRGWPGSEHECQGDEREAEQEEKN